MVTKSRDHFLVNQMEAPGVLELEHSFMRCPHEGLATAFRGGQKLLDREIELILQAVKDVNKNKPDGGGASEVTAQHRAV